MNLCSVSFGCPFDDVIERSDECPEGAKPPKQHCTCVQSVVGSVNKTNCALPARMDIGRPIPCHGVRERRELQHGCGPLAKTSLSKGFVDHAHPLGKG